MNREQRNLRVLVVDDDAFAARVHAKLLENAGYDVSVETTSANVLTRMTQDRPELVSSIDIVPTILAAAGARQPKLKLPGLNLLGPMTSGKAIKRKAILVPEGPKRGLARGLDRRSSS